MHLRVLSGLCVSLFSASSLNAALIGTPWVHAEASIGQPASWQSTDEGYQTTAVVDSGVVVSGNHVHSEHSVVFSSSEAALVSLNKSITRGSANSIGQGSSSDFLYDALSDSTLDYSWSLDYTFSASSFASDQGGTVILGITRWDDLGQAWVNAHSHSLPVTGTQWNPGEFDGSDSVDLVAGNRYKVSVNHSSNSLALGANPASMNGTVAFDFNGVEIPLPGAAWLFGFSLLGLIGISRRKKA